MGKNEYANQGVVWVVAGRRGGYHSGIISSRSNDMAKIWELLDQTYYFIGKKHYAEAQLILDKILHADPQNVDAWDAYIRICTTQRDLESLKNRIMNIWETRVHDDYLQATQRFILQRVDDKISSL
jgi:hypothetical protein